MTANAEMEGTARARAAVTAVFFLNGAVFSSWYARLPGIQDRLDLDAGALGIALLGAPLGLLAAQPLVGAFIARRGSRPLVAVAPLYMAAVVLPALAIDARTLLVALIVVGALNGTLDIAMNAQGLSVERVARRPLFNSLHAAFSFGVLAGAGSAGVVAGAGVAPLPHLAGCAVIGALAAAVAARGLLPAEADARPQAPRLARPSRRLAGLGALAFCALLAEGAVFDWSGIYLVQEAGAGVGVAAWGLAAFSVAMAFGRLGTDRLAAGRGSVPVGRAGAALAAAGLAFALATATPAGGIAGFAVMGLGLSAVFPLALRAAGGDPERSSPALAAVSTVGYTGFLLGPPTIGLLAQATSLRSSLVLVCGLCLVAAALAPHLRAARRVTATAGLERESPP